MTRYRVIGLALAFATLVFVPVLAADGCASTTNCTYDFTIHNVGPTNFGTGPYGTVNLTLVSASQVKVIIDLADGFHLIDTGFPGAFGFNEVGAPPATALTYGNFMAGNTVGTLAATAFYSGGTDTVDGNGLCKNLGQHFDGFGCFDHTAGTTAPSAGSANAKNVVSFTVTRGAGSWTDVHSLVAPSVKGDQNPLFVADVVQTIGCTDQTACTGLIGATDAVVPEPMTYAALLAGFGVAFTVMRRRRGRGNNT